MKNLIFTLIEKAYKKEYNKLVVPIIDTTSLLKGDDKICLNLMTKILER